MAKNIWVLAETWRGQISDITYELLALGRELADGSGAPLEAVLVGHRTQELAETLGVADNVLCADHPALAEPIAQTRAPVLSALVRQRQPRILLVPLTNVSWDEVGLLPAYLGVTFVNLCRNVRIAGAGLEADCLLYGGKMVATVALAAEPTILGILPGVRPADGGRSESAPAVEVTDVAVPELPAVRFKGYLEPEAGDVDITQQEVLVAVGRGIEGEDNVELAEELATALGGAVCGSRPAIDQGWLPLSRQVGKSGVIVKPRVYLAFGVSGAPEHTEGMVDSELIVAVNTDPEAPIFNVAHYGIVEDAMDMLEALTEAALVEAR